MAEVLRFEQVLRQAQRNRSSGRRSLKPTYFNRRELQLLVAVYSENVMAGEWRDYALDHYVGMALFSIYRRSEERPLYVVAKRQVGPGVYDYLVFESGRRARRAGSLTDALDFFRRKLTLVT